MSQRLNRGSKISRHDKNLVNMSIVHVGRHLKAAADASMVAVAMSGDE